jgi:alanyl-tRNA synthetase
VIADHIRCLTFALTDGAVPSNEGRGYVLRRILRRAVRFGRQQLELKQPFLHEMVNVVVDAMGDAFPELKKNPKHVVELIKDEELSFGKTLDRGIALFDEAAQSSIANRQSSIPAADAFKLHDTFGFPIDLTEQMAIERGMTVDIAGYEKLMDEAREKARAGGKGGDSPVFTLPPAVIAELQKNGAAPTDDKHKFKSDSLTAKVVAIWNGARLESSVDTTNDSDVAVLLDRTNFYAEMGGQVGDRGQLASTSSNFDVLTTRVVGGYVLHVGKVAIGKLNVGDPVTAVVSKDRASTQKNHTATHLANWALREILGDGVQQKGSLVDPEKLRFDFSHNASLKEDELAKIEQLVGETIKKDYAVYAEEAPQEQALKISGLRAVFGEKYPPMVRVVSIGASVGDLLAKPDDSQWRSFSIEFCGGTHLASTGPIEKFVITSEESVSKGIRRIVAQTGQAASAAVSNATNLLEAINHAKSKPEQELPTIINALQKQTGAENMPLLAKRRAQAAISELQDKLKKWEKSQKATGGSVDIAAVATELLASAADFAGGKLIIAEVPDANADQLRGVLDSIRKRATNVAALVVSSDGAKLNFITAVTDDLVKKGLKAGDWVKEAAKVTGGGGGGSAQMGQAGGKDPTKLADALDAAKKFAVAAVRA